MIEDKYVRVPNWIRLSWWRYKLAERITRCSECGGHADRHYLGCSVWGITKR